MVRMMTCKLQDVAPGGMEPPSLVCVELEGLHLPRVHKAHEEMPQRTWAVELHLMALGLF